MEFDNKRQGQNVTEIGHLIFKEYEDGAVMIQKRIEGGAMFNLGTVEQGEKKTFVFPNGMEVVVNHGV